MRNHAMSPCLLRRVCIHPKECAGFFCLSIGVFSTRSPCNRHATAADPSSEGESVVSSFAFHGVKLGRTRHLGLLVGLTKSAYFHNEESMMRKRGLYDGKMPEKGAQSPYHSDCEKTNLLVIEKSCLSCCLKTPNILSIVVNEIAKRLWAHD